MVCHAFENPTLRPKTNRKKPLSKFVTLFDDKNVGCLIVFAGLNLNFCEFIALKMLGSVTKFITQFSALFSKVGMKIYLPAVNPLNHRRSNLIQRFN